MRILTSTFGKLFVCFALALSCLAIPACERKPESAAEIAKEAPVTSKTSPELVTQQSSFVAPDGSTVTAFDSRVKDYMALQKQLIGSLKDLPDRASPREIDANQRALAALVAKARADAKQGDIFVEAMQTYIRAVVRRVLAGPDGSAIEASLMDENPMKVPIEINGRYPDTIPMSTMPPDILSALPQLPETLEYRFLGNRLILLDTRAHIIVDFVANTFDL